MNIKDIAAAAGVSVSTISKIINKKDRDISDDTRKKVLDIVKKYNYTPYMKVISRQAVRSHIIALVIEKRDDKFNQIVTCLERELAAAGYNLMFVIAGEEKQQQEYNAKILCGKNIDAAIIISGKTADYMEKIFISEKIPVFPLLTNSIAVVSKRGVQCNFEKLGYALTEYLLNKGHSKIICIFNEEDKVLRDGYKRALYDKKIPYDPIHVYTENILSKNFDYWFPLDCTAILCNNTKTVVQLYKILSSHGIRIPADVSVACIYDSEYAEVVTPTLTSLQILWAKIAKEIVKQIVSELEIRTQVKTIRDSMFFTLIERASVTYPSKFKRGQKIIVIGSMNMDVNIALPKIPIEGENLTASSISLIPGGKGANQAVGAARLGADVYAFGCLGNDSAAKELYNNLVSNNVKTDGILFNATLATGKAYINIAQDGGSTIVIYPGANNKFNKKSILNRAHLFDGSKYCLLSAEIPEEAVKAAIEICFQKNIKIILKPSGICRFPVELMRKTTFFVPNFKELNLIVPGEKSIEEKAQELFSHGIPNIIVTMGENGCYLKNISYSRFFPPPNVSPVDTTGGADAFVSTLAVYLSEGVDLIEAIGFATCSAGICVSGYGVQPVLPQRDALEMYKGEIELNFTSEKL